MKNKLTSTLNTLAPYFNEGSKIMLSFFCSVAIAIFALYSVLAAAHPYPMDYGEAPLIDQAMRLAKGQNIYRANLDSAPYTIANYPPLYQISLIPFLNTFESPFQAGRIISILATLASATFLGLTTYKLFQNRFAALVTSVLFLSFPYVVSWASLARIDSLALAFATAAIFVLVKWPKSWMAFFGGGLLLIAAAYTRQSYALAAPLAAFVWLWTQEKRRAIYLTLLVGGVGVALFGVINFLTGGGFFYNIITANANEFGWERLWNHLKDLGGDAPIILIMGGVFLASAWKELKGWSLLAPFLVGAALSALTIGKIGSNINYFLELTAALSLVGGAMIAWNVKRPWVQTIVLLSLTIQMGMLAKTTMNESVDWNLASRRADFNALQILDQTVEDLEGEVLADEYMGILTLQNRPLYLQPFEVTQLANAGMWNQTPLLDDIAGQKFAGILIHHFGDYPVHKERWTPEMLAAIEKYYRPEKTLAGTVVYLPQEGKLGISMVTPPPAEPVFSDNQAQVGPLLAISNQAYMAQPYIAVNPANPEHLAAIVTTSSKFECELSNCKIALNIYTSTDSGKTWSETLPFTNTHRMAYNGMVAFGLDGTLYALGIRDDVIALNSSRSEENYEMSRAHYEEITKAQVVAKPWLRIDPQSGQLLVTLDAQGMNSLYVTPSLLRSDVEGRPWSTISRADQYIAIADFSNGRAIWPDDIQPLVGDGTNVSLVWTWKPGAWRWPRTVWMANSTNWGKSFAKPAPILETWSPINTAFANGQFAIIYRTGTEDAQKLAVAVTADNGQSWVSTIVSDEILPYINTYNFPNLGTAKAPGISMSPNGTIDVVFYAYAANSNENQPEAFTPGQIDTCSYNVFYTFSKDGGQTFSQPIQLNDDPIRGEDFMRIEGASQIGSHLAIASTDNYAYPIWIETPETSKTQIFTVQISR